MLVELGTLQKEIPAIVGMDVPKLCDCLAMLGFPVDGVEINNGITVLDVDVTANRGDALSHRGLARDLAVVLDSPLADIAVSPSTEGAATIIVSLEADACPAYATAILTLDCSKPNQTPDEIATFLSSMGSSAKGLAPVDASNELLHRYGQPTHAFDADKLKGNVCVRWAIAGETLLALDGIQRTLTTKDMVIADESGPIALAGVIGGDSTKVTESTKRVFLESAFFDPATVRATAHRHSIHTDASYRFGRGTDIAFVKTARDLLVDRLISWADANLISSWTVGQCNANRTTTSLTQNKIDRVAGSSIPPEEAVKILTGLGCQLESSNGSFNVCPPSWRHDLTIEEDFIEEILRMRGYYNIKAEMPILNVAPEPLPDSYLQKQRLSKRLTHLGFFQTITMGFIRPESDSRFIDNTKETCLISNPLGVEYSAMRRSLLPSIWEVAKTNQRYGAKDVRLFEIAPIFQNDSAGPKETFYLGIVRAGTIGGEDPLTPGRPVQTADLIAIARDIGYGGAVNIIELGQGAFGLEIPLAELPEKRETIIPQYIRFSRHPVVTRDLSLFVPVSLCYEKLEKTIKDSLENAPIIEIRCIDVFKDHKLIESGKQTMLIRLKFQAFDKTLTSEEVEGWVSRAIEATKMQGAFLRS
ncbi:MAG: phenylalanine--tRNA ligase subunit beta [Holophagaceae bacterium]|nr:phenylalanine--tRNA ligase subunit beta [Holophagaceae bacterium]